MDGIDTAKPVLVHSNMTSNMVSKPQQLLRLHMSVTSCCRAACCKTPTMPFDGRGISRPCNDRYTKTSVVTVQAGGGCSVCTLEGAGRCHAGICIIRLQLPVLVQVTCGCSYVCTWWCGAAFGYTVQSNCTQLYCSHTTDHLSEA